MTDQSLVETWLAHQESPLTRAYYKSDFALFREFIGPDTPLASVTQKDMGEYKDYLAKLKRKRGENGKPRKLSKARQAGLIMAVRSFYAFATKHEYMDKNPTIALKMAKTQDRIAERIMTRDDVDKLILAAETDRDSLLLRVLFYSGARVTELIGIQWRHVKPNPEGGQLSLFGKGGKSRTVLIPLDVYQSLVVWKGEQSGNPTKYTSGRANDYVFATQKSPQMSRGMVQKVIKDAAKASGVTWAVSAHWFRHTHASIALQKGANLRRIQLDLGHESLKTTEKYLHAMPDDGSALYLDKK